MSAFSDDLRKRAGVLDTGADTLLADQNAEALAGDVRQQIAAIVGKVSAIQLSALADLADHLLSIPVVDEKTAKRRAIMDRNNAIRVAASRGNWDEFDRLSGIVDTTDGGGTAVGGEPGV